MVVLVDTLDPVSLVYKYDLKYETVAELFGVSVDAVSDWMRRRKVARQTVWILAAIYDQQWSKEGCPYVKS